MDKLRKLFRAITPDLDAQDVLYTLGLLMFGIGLGGYDWRVGLIGAGSTLLYTVLSIMHKGSE